MLSLTIRNLLAHRRRLVGTALAVILGVAFLAASLVMGDTMRQSFRGLFGDLTAGSDVVVRNTTVVDAAGQRERGPVPTDLLDELTAVDGVAAAAPDIEGSVQIVGSDGEPIGGEGPPVLALNWIEDPDLNPMVMRDGRAPRADGEIALDQAAARRAGLEVGDTATIHTPAPAEMRLVGLFTVGDLDTSSGTTFVAFDTDTAAGLLTRPGELDSIRLSAAEGIGADELRDRIASTLDPGFEALTGSELADELQADAEGDFLGVIDKALLMFSGIALVVAAFSIHNTFSIIVAQRSRESALLRAIGASRRQVLVSVAVEALAIGAVASAAGLAVGIGLAAGLKALLASAGLELVVSGVVVTVGALVTAFLIGVVMTMLSSLLPSLRASRIAPIEALRDLAVDDGTVSRLRGVSGVVLTGLGAAMVIGPSLTGTGSVSLAGIGALVTIGGVLVLGPVVARPVTSIIGAPLGAIGGTSGRLARRNAARDPRRTAGSAAALLVGVSIVTLMATVGASIKTSVGELVDRSFGGDLVIDPGWGGVGLDPALAADVAELDEVESSVGISSAVLAIDGRDSFHLVTDPAGLAAIVELDDEDGSVADVTPDQIAISRRYATDHDLSRGDTVTAGFSDGAETRLTVAAVYGSRDLMGDVIVHEAGWIPHAGAIPTQEMVLVELRDGVDRERGQAAVQTVSDDHGGPTVQNRAEYVDAMASQIDQLLILVYGMLGLAVLIALMGIANTLLLSIHERTRELGLLRAVGQSRAQMRATVRGESVITAVFGTVGGIGLGTFLGWALVRVVAADEGIGTVTVPTSTLSAVTVIAVLAGVVAAIRPARRAARLDVLTAIAGS